MFIYWNNLGIAPEKSQLVEVDNAKGVITPSEMYKTARELNLSVFAWSFRLDQLPNYVKSYNELLKIFTDVAPLDGIITDFPADTIAFLNAKQLSAATIKISNLFCLISSLTLFKFLF